MHINSNNLDDFQNDAMDTTHMIAFLEHLDQCDYCLEQLLKNEPEKAPIPAGMKESILSKADSLEIHTEKAFLEASYRVNSFYKVFRTVVVGTVLSLIMLLGLTFSSPAIAKDKSLSQDTRQEAQADNSQREARNSLHSFSSGITEGLSDGSTQIIKYINLIFSPITNGGK